MKEGDTKVGNGEGTLKENHYFTKKCLNKVANDRKGSN